MKYVYKYGIIFDLYFYFLQHEGEATAPAAGSTDSNSDQADENFNVEGAVSSSPPPAPRSETAGSVRSRIQPTLMEVT